MSKDQPQRKNSGNELPPELLQEAEQLRQKTKKIENEITRFISQRNRRPF